MQRRRFITLVGTLLKSAALASLLPVPDALPIPGPDPEKNDYFRSLDGLSLKEMALEKMHHGRDGRFLNPLGALRHRRGFGRLLYWKLFSENKFKADLDAQPFRSVRCNWSPVNDYHGLSVTFVKHACLLIKEKQRSVIVDPVFGEIFGFIKDFTPLELDRKNMPAVDHILVTHGHYDHFDKESLAAFTPSTHVISPLGYDNLFRDLKMNHRTGMDWYDSHFDGHWEITLLPCNHWTMRNPFAGPNRALWGSYLIRTAGGKTIYIAGDTAHFDGFQDIGREFDIDLAVFNLGAYEPRWFMAPSHMDPRETVQAFQALGAKKLMIVHWGTFRLGDEPVHFPPLDLKNALDAAGLADAWIPIEHGQTHFF